MEEFEPLRSYKIIEYVNISEVPDPPHRQSKQREHIFSSHNKNNEQALRP